MKTKINSLSFYRRRYAIPLHDVAYLLRMDISNLSKMEQGIRKANPQTILLYHILFKAPLISLFENQFVQLKQTVKGRSETLIKQLKTEKSSKSKRRIAYISRIVNELNQKIHD